MIEAAGTRKMGTEGTRVEDKLGCHSMSRARAKRDFTVLLPEHRACSWWEHSNAWIPTAMPMEVDQADE